MTLEQKINLLFIQARIRMDARIYGIDLLDDFLDELASNVKRKMQRA